MAISPKQLDRFGPFSNLNKVWSIILLVRHLENTSKMYVQEFPQQKQQDYFFNFWKSWTNPIEKFRRKCQMVNHGCRFVFMQQHSFSPFNLVRKVAISWFGRFNIYGGNQSCFFVGIILWIRYRFNFETIKVPRTAQWHTG